MSIFLATKQICVIFESAIVQVAHDVSCDGR